MKRQFSRKAVDRCPGVGSVLAAMVLAASVRGETAFTPPLASALPAAPMTNQVPLEPSLECAATLRPRAVAGFSIALVPEDEETRAPLVEAMRAWSTCESVDLPPLVLDAAAVRTIRVRWVRGSSGSLVCGTFAGSTIRVYSHAEHAGRVLDCAAPAVNIAHEIGHVLGLLDAPHVDGCKSHVMAADDWRVERTVRPAECRAATEYWRAAAANLRLTNPELWARRAEAGTQVLAGAAD